MLASVLLLLRVNWQKTFWLISLCSYKKSSLQYRSRLYSHLQDRCVVSFGSIVNDIVRDCNEIR
jgi:hypothetical protein